MKDYKPYSLNLSTTPYLDEEFQGSYDAPHSEIFHPKRLNSPFLTAELPFEGMLDAELEEMLVGDEEWEDYEFLEEQVGCSCSDHETSREQEWLEEALLFSDDTAAAENEFEADHAYYEAEDTYEEVEDTDENEFFDEAGTFELDYLLEMSEDPLKETELWDIEHEMDYDEEMYTRYEEDWINEDQEFETVIFEDYETPSVPGNNGLSSVALQAEKQWNSVNRPKKWIGKVHGLVVHTTGGSLPGNAIKCGVYPTVYAMNYYTGKKKNQCEYTHTKNSAGGCHYINGWQGMYKGDLLQIANEQEMAHGVGTGDQRRSIKNGSFEKDLPAKVAEHWKKRWLGYSNSMELLPDGERYANTCYIHVECIPVVYYKDGKTFISEEHPPMRKGLRFTKAQHDTVAYLACDIAVRNGWPLQETWWKTTRLLGHEDLTPISRKDKNGGWDPGGLRDSPYFDWDYVYEQIERIKNSGYKLTDNGASVPVASSTSWSDTISKGKDVLSSVFQKGQLIAVAVSAISKGERDENKVTNTVFYTKYPDKKGRKLQPKDPLAVEWIAIRTNIVRPLFRGNNNDTSSGSTVHSVPGKFPAGFKPVKRNGKIRGLSRYAEERLDKKLLSMKNRGLLSISADEIDLFQRIANVETGGKIQGINTWDSAVVSIGFMQLTLQHGKIQKWINRIPSAFKKYGIELTSDKSYAWQSRNRKTNKISTNRQFGIMNAQKNELRWSPWAERFYKAGLDEAIIVAEVEEAREYLITHLNRAKNYLNSHRPGYKEKFGDYYNENAYLRGMFQAAYNNLPGAAKLGSLYAMRQAEAENYPAIARFIEIYKRNLQRGYDALKDPEGAKRLIAVTKNGSQP